MISEEAKSNSTTILGLRMGGTEERDKHEDEVEKKEKKEKSKDIEGKDEEKSKEKKKKKDKDGKEKEKNPEDNKDPVKLRAKLGKLDSKMQALTAKREEILKLLQEVETKPSESNEPAVGLVTG